MKRQATFILLAIVSGFVLTFASVVVSRSLPFSFCELNESAKGFPLPIILVAPSVSLCNDVSSISVLWEGNASHQEYMGNFAIDLVFWSSLSGGAFYILKRHQSARQI